MLTPLTAQPLEQSENRAEIPKQSQVVTGYAVFCPWAPTLSPTPCPGSGCIRAPANLEMDRFARLDAWRDDDAVDELAQLEARSLGIASRKRFCELLNRVEIDGDSSRMQGDDVRLGYPGEARLLEINLGLGEPALTMRPSSRP
jgi:hypothetical protein